MFIILAALALLAIVILPAIVMHRADKRAGLLNDRIATHDMHHANAMDWRQHNSRRVYPTNDDNQYEEG